VPNFAWKAPAESNVIDTLVNAKLKQLQISRRILAMTAPSSARAPRPDWPDSNGGGSAGVHRNQSPDKRAKLIDELLAGEAFARFWTLKQADLMRVSKSRLTDGRAEAFRMARRRATPGSPVRSIRAQTSHRDG